MAGGKRNGKKTAENIVRDLEQSGRGEGKGDMEKDNSGKEAI